MLVASAAALIVALAVTAAVIIPGSSPSRAAAAELTTLAQTAFNQPTPVATADESLYSKRVGEATESFDEVNGVPSPGAQATFSVTLETWARTDGSMAFQVQFGDPQFASQSAQSAWTQAGLPLHLSGSPQVGMASLPSGGRNGDGISPVIDVSTLPTDPTRLGREIEDGQTGLPQLDDIPPGPGAALQRIASIFMGPLSGTSPQLYAALYQVLSSQPGVESLGTTTTHAGTTGMGFSFSGGQSRLVIDPSTGTLIEVQNVPLANGSLVGLLLPTSELVNQLPEPRTAGGTFLPGHDIWFDTVANDQIVSNTSLPPNIQGIIASYTG
jgi:hypothetical protein